MSIFKKNKISEVNELFADSVKKTRQAKKIGLKQASAELNINIKYLEAIENGKFNDLPEGLYRKNYIKEYTRYLGLETEELNKVDTEAKTGKTRKTDPFSRKVPSGKYFLLMPRAIKNTLIIIITMVCLAYLVFSINNIIKPPELKIVFPAADLTVNEQIIKIQGFTEKETKIIINEEEVLTDKEGSFTKLINLKKGINTIIIIAEKKYSRKNIIERKIIVEEQNAGN